MLTIVDECTRESPAIEVDTSLGEFRVRRVLDRIAIGRGLPEAIVLDNGPFFGTNGNICSCKSASLARSPPPMCFHYSDQKRAGFAFLISTRGGRVPVLSGYGQPIP